MTQADRPAVGWKPLSWSGDAVLCNVPPCSMPIRSGWVRVDRQRPWAGDPVICTDCHFKIQLGIDPGGDPLPEWERERREAADPDK